MSAYHRRLTGNNDAVKQKCAKAWTKWEMATSRLFVDPENVKKAESDAFAATFASIECHYFVNGGFFKCKIYTFTHSTDDGQLIEEADKIKNIPGVIVQGRYDVVCPPISAWDLSKKWNKGKLVMISDAGHSMKEPGILSALVEACDELFYSVNTVIVHVKITAPIR
jgi:proline iminopeptidase